MYRQKLINYMELKNNLVKAYTDIDLYTEEDFDEIYIWSDEMCETAFMALGSSNSDAAYCPWCVRIPHHCMDCDTCGYCQRHGDCFLDGSSYRIITDKITARLEFRSAILNIPGLPEALDKYLDENV